MQLICDSGSTKTHWFLMDSHGKTAKFQSHGLNPYFTTQQMLRDEIEKTFNPALQTKIEQVHFYGSGCAQEDKANFIKQGLANKFVRANIKVHSDLLGSARALFQNSPGLAIILGTGAAQAYYDGGKIKKIAPSLGYILGDEGSGAYFGKKIITAYLSGDLPPVLKNNFEKHTAHRYNEILENLYSKPFPNRYLASFMPFIINNINNEYIRNLIDNALIFISSQMKCHFEPNELKNIGFTGSVSYYLQDFIKKQFMQINQYQVSIIKDSIHSLSIFHANNKSI